MKKEEANRLLAICKNFDNVSTLLGDLVMPIAAMKQKYKCTGACVKSVRQMTNVIDE